MVRPASGSTAAPPRAPAAARARSSPSPGPTARLCGPVAEAAKDARGRSDAQRNGISPNEFDFGLTDTYGLGRSALSFGLREVALSADEQLLMAQIDSLLEQGYSPEQIERELAGIRAVLVSGSVLDLVVGFTPLLGEVQALFEILGGRSVATGEDLSAGERAIAFGSSIVPFVPGSARAAKRLPGAVGRGGDNVLRAIDGARGGVRRLRLPYTDLDPLDDLAAFRQRQGLPAAGSAADTATTARLDVNGQTFYGQNAPDRPFQGRVNAQTSRHAEGDVFQQAVDAGVTDSPATLYVDRPLCRSCGAKGEVGSLLRGSGIDEVTVVTPEGAFRITADQPSRPIPLGG